jgi:NADPH:quinone reductase-like Zn-dependent oxidoreductase
MKAIRIHEPTGISGLVFEEVPDPNPVFLDVVIKVAACGITHNELDWPVWTCRTGHPRTSIIPGHEVSGVVTALGYGTAGIDVGDEVFALTDQFREGAAAEYVAVEARNVAPKPQTVDHVRAAAVPRAGLTAWQAAASISRSTRSASRIEDRGCPPGRAGCRAVLPARAGLRP